VSEALAECLMEAVSAGGGRVAVTFDDHCLVVAPAPSQQPT
jgi:hypothetical protein